MLHSRLPRYGASSVESFTSPSPRVAALCRHSAHGAHGRGWEDRGGPIVIAYPTGQEPDLWDPNPGQSGYRFALGNAALATSKNPPLIAICMNPSHAREDQSDKTINRLIQASEELGYAGWIMLNLYPERSPKPSTLSAFDPALSAANKFAITQVLARFETTEVLGAWGNLTHATLRQAKLDVLPILAGLGVRVFTFDPPTKEGNPRHPSPQGRYLPMHGPKVYLA